MNSVKEQWVIFFLSFSWIKDTDRSSKLGAVTLRDNASDIMMHIRFLSQLIISLKTSPTVFSRTLSKTGFFMYLSVQEQE